MPNLIKPGDVTIITKEGEVAVNISLELTVKLDGSNLSVSAQSTGAQQQSTEDEEETKTKWAIPSFKNKKKINFGKED